LPKVDISMTPEEVDDFLGRCPTMVLASIDADGWPTGALAVSAYRDGVLSLRVNPTDPILGCIAVDDRVSCAADEHRSYFEIRGVIVNGRASTAAAGRLDLHVDEVLSFDFGRLR
jgi:Pyridoxamine 5'-phosphate oxidase